MAVSVSLFDFDGQLGIDVVGEEARERVRGDPPQPLRPTSPWIFEWDAEALDVRGAHQFLGLFVQDLGRVTGEDMSELDGLDGLVLPRIAYPPAGLQDAPISALVRWAHRRLKRGVVSPRSA